MHRALLTGVGRRGVGACGGGDVDAHVDVRGTALDRIGRVVDGDPGALAALMPADHQQLFGDEGGGQAVFVAARE
ncbi:hypothetical protein D3C76_1210130 [compost metagenome]